MQNQLHPNKIRQILFLAFLLFLGIVLAKEMYFMLAAFLGAVTLYVILRNWMIKLVTKFKFKKGLAAITLILVTLLIIILPLTWLGSITFKKLIPIIQHPEVITQTFEKIHAYLLEHFNIDILNVDNVKKLNTKLIEFAQSTIGSTMSGLGNLGIMYFLLYFMLVSVSDIESWIRNNIPFKHSNVQKVTSEFRNLVYSNAIGIPIVALAQGLVGLIGYWIFGIDEFILFGVLTAIVSVIPVVGSMAVFLPLALYQLSLGNTWQGIAIGLWGLILIGSIDNIVRFALQKRIADVHPIITIFGVLIGINMFGFMGIIFGPLMLSMFLLLSKVYIDEFGHSRNLKE